MDTTITARQIALFLKLLDEKNVTRQGLNKVFESGILADLLDEKAKLLNRPEVREALELDWPKLQLFSASSPRVIVPDYGECQKLIRERFADKYPPRKGAQRLQAKLFRTNRLTRGVSVIADSISEIDGKNPWSFASLEQLVSFLSVYEDDARPLRIYALGSAHRSDNDGEVWIEVPCARFSPEGKMNWSDSYTQDGFSIYDAFLAVRPAP